MITNNFASFRMAMAMTMTNKSSSSSSSSNNGQVKRDLSFLNEMPRLDPHSSNALLREFSYRSLMAKNQQILEKQQQEQKRKRQQEQEEGVAKAEEHVSSATKRQKKTEAENEADTDTAKVQDFKAFLKMLADTMDTNLDGNPFEPTPIVPSAISIPTARQTNATASATTNKCSKK